MMKQIRNFIGAALFLATLLVVPLASAADSTSASDTSKSSDQKTTTTTTTEDTNPDPTVLKARIEAHKTEFKIKLATAEELRLKAKCKAGQVIIKTIHDKIPENVTNRDKAYQAMLDRLNGLVTKLKATSVDTTQLEAQITVLSGKIDTYKTDLTAYKQALTDVKSLDCVADPAGFKAGLENARAKRETLSKAVLDIRAYVKDTLKPTLVTIRTALEAKEKTTTTTNGGTQ